MKGSASRGKGKSYNFCPSCGSKLPAGAKHCPNCGVRLNDEVENPEKPKKLKGLWRLFMPLVFIGPWVLISVDANTFTPDVGLAIEAISIGLLALVLIALARRANQHLKAGANKIKVYAWVSAAIFLLVIYGGVLYTEHRDRLINTTELLQVYLAEAVVAKNLGDEALARGQALTPANDRSSITNSQLADLVVPPISLRNYYNSVNDWNQSVAKAITPDLWSKLSAEPASFTLAVSSYAKKHLFKKSLEDLAAIKSFGDAALQRNDKETMRYIAGRLTAEKHLLDGLSNSSERSAWTAKVYAATRTPQPKRTVCLKGKSSAETICVYQVSQSIGPLIRSAQGYAAGQPGAATAWQTGWSPVTPAITGQGFSIGGVGISQGGDTTGPVATPVNNFWSECTAKGGSAGGTARKERLPATEGGYTCNYPVGNQQCWDFLTYSGRRFKGGNGSCPEQGLLPKAKPKKAANFDGTYRVSSTGARCDSSYYSADNFAPFAVDLEVNNNRIENPNGEDVVIDSNGLASQNYDISQAGSSFSGNFTANFTAAGQMKGEWQVDGTVTTGDFSEKFSCSGSFSGQRL